MADTAPASMNGLRTRILSETNPASSRLPARAAQLQSPSELALAWLKPNTVWKYTGKNPTATV